VSEPLVSIVIPLYNKEPWVLQSLETVVRQTYKNWEIILVNDGSTDNSLRIVNNFRKKSSNDWKIITTANSGQCPARNLGISLARGKYVAFLDPDDLWQHNKLEVQVRTLENSPNIVATICPYIIFSENRSKSLRFVNHKTSWSLLKNWLRMTGYGGGTESTGLVRRDALIQIGGFNEQLSTSAGLLLTLELSKLGQIDITNGTFMAYRIYTGQWHGDTNQLQQDVETIRNLLLKSGFTVPSKLKNWHDAYFRINAFRRNEQKLRDFCRILFSEPDKFFRLVMIICLIWRNFQAHLRSILFYRNASQSRNEIDSFLFPKDMK
jgi:glycosyltransferase involved in cell wall biosynthesis